MAYWNRRRGREVTAYYYDINQKKNVQVPRTETRHLDDLLDEDIDKWLEEWEQSKGIARIRSVQRVVLGTDELKRLIESHLEDHSIRRNTRDVTLNGYRYHFYTYIVPYFVSEKSEKDVRKWYLHMDPFPMDLLKVGLHVKTVRGICQTLVRFGRYLVRQRVLSHPWLIEMPRTRDRRKVPLTRKLDPEQAIELASKLESKAALVVLLGYFASLRPEEIYALSVSDFITGQEARNRARAWKGLQKYGLGSGLSIYITKTSLKKAVKPETKTPQAKAVVNVFNVEAAKLIASHLKSIDGRLFPENRYHLDKWYAEVIKPVIGMNCKDLERAAANYLGKRVGLDPYTLQDHMRHAEMSTTLLYTRDPYEVQENTGSLNLDDVG